MPVAIPAAMPLVTVEGKEELEFVFFPKLPPELRNHIWKNAVTTIKPRVIHVVYHDTAWSNRNSFDTFGRSPPPAMLHVCRESRQIAQKNYKLVEKGSIVYINLELDVLLFSCSVAYEHFLKVRSIEVEEEGVLTGGQINAGLKHLMVDDLFDDIWEGDLDSCTAMQGIASITFHDNMLSYGRGFQDDWKLIWKGRVVPRTMFIPEVAMKQMKMGDTAWLGAKLAEVEESSEAKGTAEDEIHVAE